MSAMKKIIALLVCIILACGCLASCVGPDNGGNDQGGEQLQSDKYIASIRIKYATNDDKMKAAVDAMGTPTATLEVDGEELKLVTDAVLDDISATNEYIYIGGVLYHKDSLTVADKTISSYERAQMGADARESLISKAGPGADIGIGDFLDQERNKSGEIISYSCSEMTDESKESLCEIFSARFEGADAIVKIEEVGYQLETKDERNHSSILSISFVVTMDGVDYGITMHLYCDYDYDTDFSITTPNDADAYTEVSIDEILG